jgi:hypothetical protein
VLWINGGPGKGKTMLLCGIIDEIGALTKLKNKNETTLLSYFFCQATDTRINNAIAVLRGLIYLLISQQPSLIKHVQEKYSHVGKALFEDGNAWVSLSEIFTSILQDLDLNNAYLIIDALDECVADLPKLLNFIGQKSCMSPRIKWVISSRNWPDIEERLERAGRKTIICLELNSTSVSETAVDTYIQFRVDSLAVKNKYDSDTRDAVQRYLTSNAHGTFLWVALVCQELASSGRATEEILTAFPPGLNAIYSRMIDQIYNLNDSRLCKSILAIVSIVYRPITLDELASFVDIPPQSARNYNILTEAVGLCGSFLAFRERTIFFVHQTAKDFLIGKAADDIFPSGIRYIHYTIFSRSLQVMSRTLRRDIYSLGATGISIDQVKQPDPDPLAVVRYSCLYWIDHLLDCNARGNATDDLKDGGSVYSFLYYNFLYWLEALSLDRRISYSIIMIRKLEHLLQVIFFVLFLVVFRNLS